jgi:hypothetical protein
MRKEFIWWFWFIENDESDVKLRELVKAKLIFKM